MIQRIARCGSRTLGLLSRISRPNARAFSSTPVETPKPEPPKAGNPSMSSKTHKVDNIERKMLVWTGKYKTADEVPSYIK